MTTWNPKSHLKSIPDQVLSLGLGTKPSSHDIPMFLSGCLLLSLNCLWWGAPSLYLEWLKTKLSVFTTRVLLIASCEVLLQRLPQFLSDHSSTSAYLMFLFAAL